ncbi:ubiquinol-cytochrome c reductase iron-sulfur subunit [Saccharospirillum sp. MSK14-1]|uniref:ubiquinol-cytochrome c reductase iron-sulfur subunit n=1 Tax=Saccharospirillum sp. MSK14-1 TaxID=1897632 RepID=UPI000D3D565A|nr:ubiquinol-cytochrome c reductase iron-sulfur subunit [Saccharospirillum sp. MSK14-1]PTY37358.1 ubiquinol-cytochrome c reductase iron-sulfur subunit [Saccharospirillum sp. MSK14-1]
MTQDGVNQGRRRFLYIAAGAMGAAGAVGVATPFVKSWYPSEKAKAVGAPVSVDIGTLEAGEIRTVEWRGKPIFVVRRTETMIENLQQDAFMSRLSDPQSEVASQQPEYAQNILRSLSDDLLVLEGVCTHLGCSPQFRPEVEPQPFDENWMGGFFCPCHGSRFDLAGRVFRGVPAPTNLVVPPHRIDGTVLTVGEEAA